MPDGNGLTSTIEPVRRRIDINDEIHERNRCFVSFQNGIILVAVLQRYNHRQLPKTTRAHVFIRMPGDNFVYEGELDYNYGHRPSWIE